MKCFLDLMEDGILPSNANDFPLGEDVATSSSQVINPPRPFVFTSPSVSTFGGKLSLQTPKRRRSFESSFSGGPWKFPKQSSVQGRPLRLPKKGFFRGQFPQSVHFTVPRTGAPHTTPPDQQEPQSNRQLPSRSDKGRAKEGKTFIDSAGE